jgi:hypothetical protein
MISFEMGLSDGTNDVDFTLFRAIENSPWRKSLTCDSPQTKGLRHRG